MSGIGAPVRTAAPIATPARSRAVPPASARHRAMRVARFLRFWAQLRGVARDGRSDRVERVVTQAGLRGVEHQLVGALSRGYRQRVALAQALVHDPPVLVLDEPTAGLDPEQVVETRKLIGRLAKTRTVLLSSHLLNEVTQLCRRVVVLDHGRVLAVDDIAALTDATRTGSLEEAYLKLVRG
jgi:ABC-2 type transport system ATP-binding protein